MAERDEAGILRHPKAKFVFLKVTSLLNFHKVDQTSFNQILIWYYFIWYGIKGESFLEEEKGLGAVELHGFRVVCM